MENQKKANLMMVAAYYRELYEIEITNSIDPEKKKELLSIIDEVLLLLKMARSKTHAVEHHGREHTLSFWGIYQGIDGMIEKLTEAKKLVLKTETGFKVDEYLAGI